MADKVQQLRPSAAPVQHRTPERTKLAAAIERVTLATAALDKLEQARARAPNPWEIEERVEQARVALTEARDGEAGRLVNKLMGEESGPSPVAAAETLLADVENDLRQARRVRELLDQREGEARREIEYAALAVSRAVGETLQASPEVAALLSEYRRQQERASALAEMLRTVSRAAGISREHKNWESIRTDYRVADLPGVSQWVSAINGLRADADAALPR